MKISGIVSLILGLCALLTVAFGVYFHFEKRYALAQEFNAFRKDIQYQMKSNQTISISQRLWVLEDRLKKNPNDTTASEEYTRLKNEKVLLEGELKSLQQK